MMEEFATNEPLFLETDIAAKKIKASAEVAIDKWLSLPDGCPYQMDVLIQELTPRTPSCGDNLTY